MAVTFGKNTACGGLTSLRLRAYRGSMDLPPLDDDVEEEGGLGRLEVD